MEQHQRIPVGYTAKRVEKRPGWLKVAAVDEICSVSGCISAGLAAWGQSHWTHNGLGLWDSQALLQEALAGEDVPATFDLFYYRLLPVAYGPNGEAAITPEDIPDFAGPRPCADLPDGAFDMLGYDCVATDWDRRIAGFGCSPLSCNYMARGIAVNRHCLIETLDDAIATARLFGREQPEPGTYFIIEVLRKQRGDGGS